MHLHVSVCFLVVSVLRGSGGVLQAGGEVFSRVSGVHYNVPGSSLLTCGVALRCSALFCASKCASSPECRSFSHSKARRQCVLHPWYFLQGSAQAVDDEEWATYYTHSSECDSQPCQFGRTCSDVATGGVTCQCDAAFTGDFCQNPKARSCKALRDLGLTTSGVTTVYPDDVTPLSVYCDQDTDGGGWVVFQRRQDGSQDFDLSLQHYTEGFGDLTKEFWLGLNHVRTFTSQGTHELRAEMGSSRTNTKHASYSNFYLDASYSLEYDAFLGGDAGDGVGPQKDYPFSVPPAGDTTFCAALYYGGWWYADSCMYCNLNGRYASNDGGGVKWYTNGGSSTSHSWSEMKIRPTT